MFVFLHCHLGGRWGVEVGCVEICGVEVGVRKSGGPRCLLVPYPVLELKTKTLGI